MYTLTYDGRVLYDPRSDDERILSCTATLEINTAGKLDVELPPQHPLYGGVAVMSAEHEVALCDDGEELFRGRITDSGYDIRGVQTLSAEGQLAYLNDSVVSPYGTYASVPKEGEHPEWTTIAPNNRHDYAEWLINQHNAQTDPCKRFTIAKNDLPDARIVRSSTVYPKTRTELDDKVCDPFTASVMAYMRDGVRYVDLLKDGGRDATQTIKFGDNLLEYAHTSRAVDAVTCIIPIGKDTAGKEFGLDAAADGPVAEGMTKQGDRILLEAGVNAHGTIAQKRSYDVETTDALIKACCDDMATGFMVVDSVDISAVDLHKVDPSIERIRLGEWVFVSARPLKFEARLMCMRIDINLLDPGATKYVFGATLPTLTNGSKSTATRMRRQESEMIERIKPISDEAKEAAKKADAAVVSTIDEYAISTMSSAPPETGWSTSTPVWTDSNYIWRRSKTTYGSGLVIVGSPALMTGNTGGDGVGVASTTRYYLLQAAQPAKPTSNPPTGWAVAEPTYSEGSNNSLYTVDLTVMSDGSWSYSGVSLSSAYEAAKDAHNKAIEAAKTATNFAELVPNEGLNVGDKTGGVWRGLRTRMTASAYQVIDQAGVVLASYGAQIVELGKNSRDAVIKLCGGKGAIDYTINSADQVSDTSGLRITADKVSLLSHGKSLMHSVSGSWSTPGSRIATAFVEAHTEEGRSASVEMHASIDGGAHTALSYDGTRLLVDQSGAYVGHPDDYIAGQINYRKIATTDSSDNITVAALYAAQIYTNRSSLYQVYGGRVLYSNDSGASGTVTLVESAAQFRALEIYYKTNDGEQTCTKLSNPNGKVASLSSARITAETGSGYLKSKQVSVSGQTISCTGLSGESGLGTAYSATGTNWAGSILITQVIGYK